MTAQATIGINTKIIISVRKTEIIRDTRQRSIKYIKKCAANILGIGFFVKHMEQGIFYLFINNGSLRKIKSVLVSEELVINNKVIVT